MNSPLVKMIPEPADDDHKRILYKQKQESTRKDMERAFGVLKKKWAVLANPTREQKKERIVNMIPLGVFRGQILVLRSYVPMDRLIEGMQVKFILECSNVIKVMKNVIERLRRHRQWRSFCTFLCIHVT
nr:protein ALP1-like [Tanacetum cinerariifolium]